jgi:2-alkenal reductase
VNTAIFSPSGANTGIGFAIPVDVVNRVVPQLIQNGRVPTPGIGIVAANEMLAAQLGVEGVIIVRTAPGSPAERAGLRGVDPSTGAIGDVIIAADGQPIRRLADLTDQLEKKGVGQTIEISARRNGRTNIYRVQIADISR